MTDTNECKLSGAIDRLKAINTKSGVAMAEILVKVRQDRFRVTAFGNLAEFILSRGKVEDRVGITGSLSISNWKDEATGEWKNSFGVAAWGVELHGEKVAYQRQKAAPPSRAGEFVAGADDPF